MLTRSEIVKQLREWADSLHAWGLYRSGGRVTHEMRVFADRIEGESVTTQSEIYIPGRASCPFCGGDWVLDKSLRNGYKEHVTDPDAFAYFVRCVSCAAQGGWAKSESGAFRLWNRRLEAESRATSADEGFPTMTTFKCPQCQTVGCMTRVRSGLFCSACCLHLTLPDSPTLAEAATTVLLTRAVREADCNFERTGGSSKHWVEECFLPAINRVGLCVARIGESATSSLTDLVAPEEAHTRLWTLCRSKNHCKYVHLACHTNEDVFSVLVEPPIESVCYPLWRRAKEGGNVK